MMQSCRLCGEPLHHVFCDLGMSPVSNSFIPAERSMEPEPHYPLAAYTCGSCMLVQLPEYKSADDIFTSDYVYFSSTSSSWLAHSESYCQMARDRFALDCTTPVIEIASNDGYLLQYFKQMGVPVLGIEPSASVAHAAIDKGIETMVRFFGADLALELRDAGCSAKLIVGNNVLAHVPDINDFIAGLKIVLQENGHITLEFPHLANLIEMTQFDTIYHEHFSYISLLTACDAFSRHGLVIYDVEQLATHGGSLRIFATHSGPAAPRASEAVARVLQREFDMKLERLDGYTGFAAHVRRIKNELLTFLIEAKRKDLRIAAYGAAAKGNTLLNYCGIRTDFIDFVADRSRAKQGLLLPGTRIPVTPPEQIYTDKPDIVLILPWNLRDEIIDQLSGIRDWGGKFLVAVPNLEVVA